MTIRKLVRFLLNAFAAVLGVLGVFGAPVVVTGLGSPVFAPALAVIFAFTVCAVAFRAVAAVL